MIIDGIMSFIIGTFSVILDLLPTINVTIPNGFMTWLIDIFEMTAYFVPLADFLAMMGIWLLVTNFHIIWKLIQRIWDAIPLT